MKRIFIIVVALVAGLVGLFMSVCGGGLFVSILFGGSLFKPGAQSVVSQLPSLALTAGFCIGGALLIMACIRAIKKWWQ
jgi:hypothetical protein